MRRHLNPDVCNGCGFAIGACECSTLRQDPTPGYVSDPPEPPEDDVEDVPDELAGKYATEGVESEVVDEEGDVLGHVGLLDLDEAARAGAEAVASRLPGPVAVLRSSWRSWHLWALLIDSLDAWQRRVEDVDAVDDEHIALNSERGIGVLRIDDKIAVASGEVVKPEPTLVSIEDSGPSYPRSAPHAEILVERFGTELDLDDSGYVGASTNRRAYLAEIGGRSDG